jgi:phage gpG-like protein
MATISFRGTQPADLVKIAEAKIAKRLEVCAILLQNEMKTGLSEHDNLHGDKDSSQSAGGNPFKVTGRLAGSITHNVDKEELTAKVGTPVIYGLFLQRGTRHMAARPFITIAWNKCKAQIQRILDGK